MFLCMLDYLLFALQNEEVQKDNIYLRADSMYCHSTKVKLMLMLKLFVINIIGPQIR